MKAHAPQLPLLSAFVTAFLARRDGPVKDMKNKQGRATDCQTHWRSVRCAPAGRHSGASEIPPTSACGMEEEGPSVVRFHQQATATLQSTVEYILPRPPYEIAQGIVVGGAGLPPILESGASATSCRTFLPASACRFVPCSVCSPLTQTCSRTETSCCETAMLSQHVVLLWRSSGGGKLRVLGLGDTNVQSLRR